MPSNFEYYDNLNGVSDGNEGVEFSDIPIQSIVRRISKRKVVAFKIISLLLSIVIIFGINNIMKLFI